MRISWDTCGCYWCKKYLQLHTTKNMRYLRVRVCQCHRIISWLGKERFTGGCWVPNKPSTRDHGRNSPQQEVARIIQDDFEVIKLDNPQNVNPRLINPGWLVVVVPPNSDSHGYWNGTPQLNSRLGYHFSSHQGSDLDLHLTAPTGAQRGVTSDGAD